ncbi:MAG: hypothetical protein DSY77_08085 [Bacteroidetes bacterium]|nr:MAG: hypothetical protein DSY77_08085 [Bacteroidota bacterium]
MLLGSLLGIAIAVLFGFQLDFVLWLVATATILAGVSFAVSTNTLILTFYLSGVVTGLITLFIVPIFLDGYSGDASFFRACFYYIPLVAFGLSIVVSTLLGVLGRVTIYSHSDATK